MSVPGPHDDGARAARDDGHGGREEASFLGPPGERLFSYAHHPAGPPLGVLVVCSPLGPEFHRNYRREVDLARRLAARGVLVQRFHYRGEGNSDGRGEDLTPASMAADALTAARAAADRTGPGVPVAFLGSRVGALAAAAAAVSLPGAPLIAWDPVVHGTRWIREAHRARMSAAAAQGGPAVREEALPLDVLGFALHRGLLEALPDLDLVAALGADPRPVLLLQLGGPELRPDIREAASRLGAAGFEAVAEHAGERESWWFLQADAAHASAAALLDRTAEWLLDRCRRRSAEPVR